MSREEKTVSALSIGIRISKVVCSSLLGDLTMTKLGEVDRAFKKVYSASFIADLQGEDLNSERQENKQGGLIVPS